MGQVVTLPELREKVGALQAAGQRIAFANGHFDILHVGHLRYLQAAKQEGDVLVVGINSDASVHRLKGADRPIVPAAERAELLAALVPVDFVVVFEGDSPAPLLADIRPDIHCKGTDYGSPEQVPEYETVREYGGRTALVGDPKDHATSDVIARIRKTSALVDSIRKMEDLAG
ncbi:MAG TPA: adenylyltransferase/cytidyltransferase family protein [Thermoanaerobaculia bacterium]|jgi:rfaE bifunctional protein nucleotidyltransferase chain/domain|nr:adenylyltransferase/cytidyltransferase family protein [Thermoanaerobaculia bacterium]